MPSPCVLLPGLDGTGELFEPFLLTVPSGLAVHAIRLPTEPPQSYSALADRVCTGIPSDRQISVIAESFSGPLAVELAERRPKIAAIVLVASFVRPPLPRWLAHVPRGLWRRPLPTAVVKRLLTGGDAQLADRVRRAIQLAGPDAISQRVRSALCSDVSAGLSRFPGSLLYLRALADRVVSSSAFEHIRSIKTDARLAEIAGPHLLLQTRPQAAWSAIRPFLEGIPAPI